MPLAPHKTVTRPARELRPVRLAIFFTLLAAHMLGVFYFARLRSPVPASSDNGFATTVFFLEIAAPRHALEVTKLRPRDLFARPRTDATPQPAAPPKTPVPSQQETTPPVAVDWAKEAERVAADSTAAEGANIGAAQAPVRRPQFAWDYAQTHRLESLPDGGLLLNLSDRCSIVLKFPMLLGGCRIGKIESRGDLFAHMHDAGR
jgi:hypothetical protein